MRGGKEMIGEPRPFPGAPVASAPRAPRATPGASATAPEDGATADGPLAPDAPDAPIAPGSLTAHRYDGRAVAEYALAFRGVPYRSGGATPAGFDCSGLVQYVFAQYGINVPRIVEEQWHVGDKINGFTVVEIDDQDGTVVIEKKDSP